MADVTKDLLIKISTEGGNSVDAALGNTELSLNSMMGGLLSVNAAWDIFNKIIGVAKTGLGFITDTFSSMIETSSMFEQLGIRFNTVFGEGGPADAALAWAKQFAATTPLTLQDVTEKMIKMKAYGFDPMSGMLETLANASYAVGTDFNGIVMALGQMSLKGHVVQQELNQLSERNIPAIKWLQEELGLTAAQMGDIGNQAISSDVAIKIIVDRMKIYDGALKKAGETWDGAWSTMRDQVGMFKTEIMDNGPWDFLIKNVLAARDALADWMESTDGANFAFTAGGIITTHLNNWKAVIMDYIVPNLGKMWDLAINMTKTFGTIWNIFIDIAGTIAVPILAGLAEIFGVTGEWSNSVDMIYSVFSKMRTELLPFIITKLGDVVNGVNELWIQMQDGAQRALNFMVLGFGNFLKVVAGGMTELSGAPLVGGAFKAISDTMQRAGDWVINDAAERSNRIATATAEAYDSLRGQRDFFKDWADGTRSDLKGWAGIIDTMKINIDDPFGVGALGKAGEEARMLWERGVNEGTRGKTLYDTETGVGLEKVTDQFGNKKYEDQEKGVLGATKDKNAIQLIPPPGDDMMTIMVKYLNMCIKTEGTIGAGF